MKMKIKENDYDEDSDEDNDWKDIFINVISTVQYLNCMTCVTVVYMCCHQYSSVLYHFVCTCAHKTVLL